MKFVETKHNTAFRFILTRPGRRPEAGNNLDAAIRCCCETNLCRNSQPVRCAVKVGGAGGREPEVCTYIVLSLCNPAKAL